MQNIFPIKKKMKSDFLLKIKNILFYFEDNLMEFINMF